LTLADDWAACGPARVPAASRRSQAAGSGDEEREMAKMQVLVELWEFLRYNKKYWIAPIVIFLVLAGMILVLAQASPIAPFIYTLF
jgi:hypothetical protein